MPTLQVHRGRSAVERLLSAYRQARTTNGFDAQAVWIAPTNAAATRLTERLLGGGATSVLATGVYTSQQLASRIVALAADRPACRQLDPAGARRLLDGVVERLRSTGRLEQYGSLEPRGALLDLLLREIDHAAAHGQTAARLARAAARAGGDRQREFAEVFDHYQREKASAGVLDRVDTWRQASELLRRDPAPRWRLAVAAPLEVGSRVEEEFVAAVLGSAAEPAIVLPPEPRRAESDGPSAPSGLLERLNDRVDVVFVDEPASNPDAASASKGSDLKHLDAWLFRDATAPPSPPAPASAASVCVLPGGGVQQEIDAVARGVKRRLLSGLAADDILIATPNVRAVAGRAAEAFSSVGAPLAIDAAPRLGEAPIVRTLLGLLALPVNDWRHEDVLRVLTSPTVGVLDRPAVAGSGEPAPSRAELAGVGLAGPRSAAEFAVRRMLLPGGRDALRDQLRREAGFASARVNEEQDPRQGARRDLMSCRAAIGAVERLAAAFAALPASATPIGWFDALRTLLDELGYAAAEEPVPGAAELDVAALGALEEAFTSLERLDRWRSRPTGLLRLMDAAELLEDWSARLAIDPRAVEEGRVRLVSIDRAVLERPRVLYLIGLVEGALPRPAPAGDPLTETDGVAHTRQEMRRFFEAATSPTEQLVLSFPSLDDKAQPLNPCSFVSEVERLFLPRSLRVEAGGEEPPLSETELRRGAVRAFSSGDPPRLRAYAAAVDADRARSTLEGVAATLQRAAGDTFGPLEGVMQGGAARREFADRYGPEHLWSASQLETYAECPFKFFMRYVLGAEPLDPLAIDLDYRRRGSLLHDAMVRFHQSLGGAPASDLGDREFQQRFEAAVAAASDAAGAAPHERPVARVEAMQAAAWGPRYRRQVIEYAAAAAGFDQPMRPAYFESRFGPSRRGEAADPASPPPSALDTDEPFRMPLGDGELLLGGRIDRIDLGVVEGRLVFNVIDYKTKQGMKAAIDDARSGVQLQLYLYALAAEQLLLRERDAAPWRIGYWAVRDKGFLPPKEGRRALAAGESVDGQVRPTDAWRALRGEMADRLRELVAGIRAAQFPPRYATELAAKNCEYRGVGRSLEARRVDKATPDPSGGAA